MQFKHVITAILSGVVVACAGCKSAPPPAPGAPQYVEIPNPMLTQGKDAPATIWVPAEDESGIPRGSVLIKEGVQMAKEGLTGTESKPAATAPSAAAPATATTAGAAAGAAVAAPVAPPAPKLAPVTVRKRIAVLETGQHGLLLPFSQQVKSLGYGVPVDVHPAKTVTEDNALSAAQGLWKENTASVMVVLSVSEGAVGGQTLVADIYDGTEQTRRRVSSVVPGEEGNSRSAAMTSAIADLAFRVGEIVTLTPWYGKVYAVEGERIYLNSGRESGLKPGQKLKVFQGSKIIPGIGFDPGSPVATIEVSGFIGTNGSYGVLKGGQSVRPGDLVAAE